MLAFLKSLDEHLRQDREIELFLGGGAAILLTYDGKLATVDVDCLRSRYREARLLRDYDEREEMDRNFRIVEVEYLARDPTEFD